MVVNLTAGAISMIFNGEWQTMDLKPVLQVKDIRIVQTQTPAAGAGGENKERYRFSLSDGSFYLQGMLYTGLSDMVRSKQVQKGSIVQLTNFVCNSIRGRLIVIVVDLNVITDKCDIIGDPKHFPVNLPDNENFSMKRSAELMQSSLIQPATTVTRPNTNVLMDMVADLPGGVVKLHDCDGQIWEPEDPPQGHRQQHHSPPPTYPDHPSSSHQHPSFSSYQGSGVPFPSMTDLYRSMQQLLDYTQRTFVLAESTAKRVGSLETTVRRIYSDVHYLRGRVGESDQKRSKEEDAD